MKDFMKRYWIMLAIVIVVPTCLVMAQDNSKISTSLDGAVVTDKTGESYILQAKTFGSAYKVYKFDVTRMKMIR